MTGTMLALAACFVALGIWQIQRRAWKHALIAAVEARVDAVPVAAPGPDSRHTADAYRHVIVTGHFIEGCETFVRAVTDLGAGYWVMTPFDTGRFVVLVNRGFVTPEEKRLSPPAGGWACDGEGAARPLVPRPTPSPSHKREGSIVGLLRISEPDGGFLRTNDPAADRWYSRDVAAIAAARHLTRVAPYFIDADASGNAPGQPVGGLTVVRFSDNHLSYALTWFGMAALCLWGLWRLRSAP